ncbi:hypothetical protein, partial [Tritonibacter sp. SIMBA_163]|uniref:hypothetical protein n=1 Tax=Tritonibacter sp. SIMBA_163 TaxID=3080868 RepID=UPI00397E9B15
KQAPTLAQRVLEALRQIRQRITGKQDTLDRIIEEFEQGLGAPTQAKEQQAAKDEAALEQMGVPQRTERRTTRVAERAAQRGMRRAEQE